MERKHYYTDEYEGDIQTYIHFYNYERLQAKLNGLSPMEFRTRPFKNFYFLYCLLDGVQFKEPFRLFLFGNYGQ
ncbi:MULTISPECIES: IS3 family transposase [Paenibacillus]|uniref:IS3 family transposase n=1 Tax=Paenibacillus TaxID=44249 RepID=UPI001BCD26A9